MNPIQVAPLNLPHEDYCHQLQVSSGVVPLVSLPLPGSICNNSTLMHQHTTQTNTRIITIDCKSMSLNMMSQNKSLSQHGLKLRKERVEYLEKKGLLITMPTLYNILASNY